ncbi:MAG: hypothetical protein Q4G11_02780 [Gallicola sp.]|nr:hypothetical protein [Gallicola sp.]
MNRIKKLFLIMGILIVVLAGIFTFLLKPESIISINTGLNVYSGKMEKYQNESGPMGDGVTMAVVDFGKEDMKNKIQRNNRWKPLPLTENLKILNYGTSGKEEGGRLPTTTDEENKPFIPEAKNGYYLFRDRQPEAKDPQEDKDIFTRSSMNFTFALFDADTNKMYYYKYDS